MVGGAAVDRHVMVVQLNDIIRKLVQVLQISFAEHFLTLRL